jgi:hypothetical protein
MLSEALVLAGEAVGGNGDIKLAHLVDGGAEQDLGVSGLVAKLGESSISAGDAGGDQFLMRERALGGSQGSDRGFRDAHLGVQSGEAHKGG